MNYTALDARAVGRLGFRPYRLARLIDRPSPVELISWPYPTDDGSALRIKIRLRPGDPTTLGECSVGELYLEEETCADCGDEYAGMFAELERIGPASVRDAALKLQGKA